MSLSSTSDCAYLPIASLGSQPQRRDSQHACIGRCMQANLQLQAAQVEMHAEELHQHSRFAFALGHRLRLACDDDHAAVELTAGK